MKNRMTSDQAQKIILHVVTKTKPRWLEAAVHWNDMDKVFLNRAYDQSKELWFLSFFFRVLLLRHK